jgi:hypothetical protein
MADRLSLANAPAEAKIERSAAERIATEIFDAIHDSVATKSDLERLGAETRAEVERLEATTRAEFATVRAEMTLLEHRLLTRLGSLVVIVAGLLFAALHYVAPVH